MAMKMSWEDNAKPRAIEEPIIILDKSSCPCGVVLLMMAREATENAVASVHVDMPMPSMMPCHGLNNVFIDVVY